MTEISSFLEQLVTDLIQKIDVTVDSVQIEQRDDTTYRVNIATPDAKVLIGRFGETLSSLQHIVKMIMARKFPDQTELFIICDIENYKQKQEEKVIMTADSALDSVKRSGRPYHLPPMSPYFRKVVHTYLKQFENDGITTHSEGEGEDRHIVLGMK